MEGEYPINDYVENDSCAKHVDLPTIIHDLLLYFRSHVRFGPLEGLELLYVLVGGKPEVCQLQVEVVVH